MQLYFCYVENPNHVLSVVNALWMLLVGERFELGDKKLAEIVRALDDVLMSAEVSSLMALLFPTAFKWLHPRFKRAKAAFEHARSLVRPKIQRRAAAQYNTDQDQADGDELDFIDLYIKRIKSEVDPESSFYADKGYKSLECVLVDLFMGGSETTSRCAQCPPELYDYKAYKLDQYDF